MSQKIEDYALIGDTLTAALVGRDGAIDWLCMPRFDSAACFCKLLGSEENGSWKIAPREAIRATRRRYRGDTLVLETEFETEQGVAALIDFMPIRESLRQVDVVRIVEGRKGVVAMKSVVRVRFDYGSMVPWVTSRDGTLRAIAGPDALKMRSPVPMRGEDFSSVAEFTVGAGQQVPFTLSYYPSHEAAPGSKHPLRMLAETESWWRQWSSRATVPGAYREPVIRSLITLKALIYEPTGGITAAATTSLPEQLGGPRNWDYRYCWLRDSTFTLYALLIGGFTEEAAKWREWLLRAIAGEPRKLQIMYGLAGERRLVEYQLDWLKGYENSKPVRVGNLAHEQFQLDVFGEVMDSFYVARKFKLAALDEAWALQKQLMEFLKTAWREPDEGIWEVRGPRRHFTHSKVMAWVAADRAVKEVEKFGQRGPVDEWRKLRDEIRADIMLNGFNQKLNAFTQFYGSDLMDASLLLLPEVGFIKATDPHMAGTIKALEERLLRDGLIQRYEMREEVDGLPPGEGAFLACTFWYVDNLALMGRIDEARKVFSRLLSLRNDVGLLAEEYDSTAHRQLGNFPQAFSHVSLVNSAHNLGLVHGPAKRRAEDNHDNRERSEAPPTDAPAQARAK